MYYSLALIGFEYANHILAWATGSTDILVALGLLIIAADALQFFDVVFEIQH